MRSALVLIGDLIEGHKEWDQHCLNRQSTLRLAEFESLILEATTLAGLVWLNRQT